MDKRPNNQGTCTLSFVNNELFHIPKLLSVYIFYIWKTAFVYIDKMNVIQSDSKITRKTGYLLIFSVTQLIQIFCLFLD